MSLLRPVLQIEAYVPGSPAQVFSYVTAFPAVGEPDHRLLEEKYGRLLAQEGNCYTFQDTTEAANRWRCHFDPPHRRVMQALESTWSDRTDTFEASGNGTRWTLTWELKARGSPTLFRWLLFRFKDRQQIYRGLVQPVLEQFPRPEYY